MSSIQRCSKPAEQAVFARHRKRAFSALALRNGIIEGQFYINI